MDPLFDTGRLGALALGIGLTLYLLSGNEKRKTTGPPPGPRRLPFIGNAHQLPTKKPWEVFTQWAKTYGDLMQVDLFGQPIVIVNTKKIASDLMDKRSALYSDRPVIPMVDMTAIRETFVFQPYNNFWRKQRKMIAQDFAASGAAQYAPLQEREWRNVVKTLIQDPDNTVTEIKRRAGAIIIRATYGYYVRSPDDPILTTPLTAIAEFSRVSVPGAYLVNMFPALRKLPSWLPGTEFLSAARKLDQLYLSASHDAYNWCKNNVSTGKTLMPNVCCNVWDKYPGGTSPEEQYQILHAAGGVLGGGLESNVSTALIFLMQMILHPEIQLKAQAEIDSIVGTDRLPSISDRPNLPYLRSIMTETMRIMPALPLCVAHALKQDDIYEGYLLPKGAWIMPNVWAMLHDPAVYPSPEEFNPDRYNNDDELMEQVKLPSFGFGRRVCPGRQFAENSLFALFSTILATCEVLPGLDENGKEVMPSGEYKVGTIVFPEAFKLRLKPRSAAAEALLAEVAEVVE